MIEMLTNEEWRFIDTIAQSPKIIHKDGGLRSTLPLWTLWPTLNEKGKHNGYYNSPLTVGGKINIGLPLFDGWSIGDNGEVQLDNEVNLPFFTSQEDCLKYSLMLPMLAENCGGVAMTKQDFHYNQEYDLVLEDGTECNMDIFDTRSQFYELKMYDYERLWDSEQARFTLKGLEPAYTPTAVPVLPFILDELGEDDERLDIYDTYRKVSKEVMMMKATLRALIERGKSKQFYQLCDDLLEPFMDGEE